jgi:hypothetical protein
MIEKFYPSFSIGLLPDPSSAGVINEMRREYNTKFGCPRPVLPWRGIRLIYQINSWHLESSRDALAQIASKYAALEMKLEAPFISHKDNGAQGVGFRLSFPPSFSSLVDELSKHFYALQRETFRTLGTTEDFPQKSKSKAHWSNSRLHRPIVHVYSGRSDVAEQVLGDLQKIHPSSINPLRIIGLKLWLIPREDTGEDQSSTPEYSTFNFGKSQ